MARFSERFGFREPRVELKPSDFPKGLRNNLWDALCFHLFEDIGKDGGIYDAPSYSEKFRDLVCFLQFNFFEDVSDEISKTPSEQLAKYRHFFMKCGVNEAYEFIEEAVKVLDKEEVGSLEAFLNLTLKKHKAAFRMIDGVFIQVTHEEELDELSESIVGESAVASVAEHIRTAAILYSSSQPDYRNSIKESISAVEAAVRWVTGKKTYGITKPLKSIEKEFNLHPALRDGFDKLYSFTSDAQGIRHALVDKADIDSSDARYMLISCSAFSNYLIGKKENSRKNE